MLDFIAPGLTLVLAILGFFFAREGKGEQLSSLGYLILALTVGSGLFAIYDAVQKSKASDDQKATIARLQRDARRLNNLNIATLVGVNRTPAIVRFFGGQQVTDDDTRRTREKELGRALADNEFVPEKIYEDFHHGLISKRDLGQTLTISGNYLGAEIELRVVPKTDSKFSVAQKVGNVTQTYECAPECPGQNAPRPIKPGKLENTRLLFLDADPSESYYGLELSDGSSVGRVISALQSSEVAIFTIVASFKKKSEYEKFKRIVRATTYRLKLYDSGIRSKTAECFVAVTVPIISEVKDEAPRLAVEIRLTGFDSLDIDLCETGP